MMGAVTCNQLHEIDRAIDALLFQQCPDDFESWWKLLGDAIHEVVPKDVLRTWSESGNNFDERAFESQYRSLSNRPSTGRTGMLFKKARAAGWVDRNPGKRPSAADLEARKKLAADVEAKAASAKAKRHADAEKRVEKLLEGTGAPSPDLPQLKGKKVGVHGDLRFLPEFELRYVDEKTGKWCSHIERDVVAIPIRTERDKITSLQLLFTSKNNPTGENKYFLPGGRTAGGYFVIGRVATTTKEIDVVEGYTTGASIFDAQAVGGTSSETAVMVAFSAGNLAAVAKGIRLKLGDGVKIVFGADNDQWKECNTGVEAAKAAARAVGGYLAIPPFEPNEHTGVDEKGRPIGPTDWNDWHLKNGLENVAFHIRKSIEAGPFVAEHGADEAAIDRAAGFAQIASEEGPAPEQPAENAEAVAESAVQTQAVVKERKLKIVTAPLIERVEPAAYSLGGASDSGLPASVISEATGSIDALGASSELGIIPLGVLSDMYAFWRIDTGTLELIQSDAVAKEASFLRLSSKQGWEIWCQGGPGKYDKSFIANAIVQTSKHLGPMNLGLVPVSMASPEKVNEAYAQAMLSKKQSPGMAAQMLSAHPGWKKAGIWFNVFANEIQITNEPPCMGGAGTWSDHHDVLLCGWVSSQWGVTITTKCAAEAITALAM